MGTIITLPIPEADRKRLSECNKTCDAAYAEYNKTRDAAYAEYVKTRKVAYAEYNKTCDAAYAEYKKTRDAAYAEYKKACKVACAEYNKTCDAAYAEYNKTRDAAYAEYNKTCDASPLVKWIIDEFQEWRSDETNLILKELADGASMNDLIAFAENSEWCDEWDEALAAARERFDIR